MEFETDQSVRAREHAARQAYGAALREQIAERERARAQEKIRIKQEQQLERLHNAQQTNPWELKSGTSTEFGVGYRFSRKNTQKVTNNEQRSQTNAKAHDERSHSTEYRQAYAKNEQMKVSGQVNHAPSIVNPSQPFEIDRRHSDALETDFAKPLESHHTSSFVNPSQPFEIDRRHSDVLETDFAKPLESHHTSSFVNPSQPFEIDRRHSDALETDFAKPLESHHTSSFVNPSQPFEIDRRHSDALETDFAKPLESHHTSSFVNPSQPFEIDRRHSDALETDFAKPLESHHTSSFVNPSQPFEIDRRHSDALETDFAKPLESHHTSSFVNPSQPFEIDRRHSDALETDFAKPLESHHTSSFVDSFEMFSHPDVLSASPCTLQNPFASLRVTRPMDPFVTGSVDPLVCQPSIELSCPSSPGALPCDRLFTQLYDSTPSSPHCTTFHDSFKYVSDDADVSLPPLLPAFYEHNLESDQAAAAAATALDSALSAHRARFEQCEHRLFSLCRDVLSSWPSTITLPGKYVDDASSPAWCRPAVIETTFVPFVHDYKNDNNYNNDPDNNLNATG